MFVVNHVALIGIVAKTPNDRIHVAARRPLSFVIVRRRIKPKDATPDAARRGNPRRFVLSAICAQKLIPTNAHAYTMTDISCDLTSEYPKP
jgi:hypothetical protein